MNGGTFQVALAKPQPSLLNSTVDDINNVSNSYSPSGGGSSVYSEDSNWLDGFECAIEISLYFSDKKLLGRVPGAASGGNLNTQPIQTRRIELPKTLFQCSGNRTIIPKYTSVRFDGTFFSSLDVLFSVFDLGDAVAFHHKKQSASTSINQQQPQTATKTLRPVTASIFKSLQTMFVPASGSSNNASNIDDAASNISDANSINNDGLSRTSSEVRFSSVLLEVIRFTEREGSFLKIFPSLSFITAIQVLFFTNKQTFRSAN